MWKVVGCYAILGSVVLLIPAASVGQDRKDKKKDTVTKEDTTPDDYKNLAQVKEIVGKIAAVDVTAGTMTFTIEWSHWEPNKNAKAAKLNQKAQQLQQQLLREYDQIMLAKNPVQRQQALMKFQVHLQQLQATGANVQNMFHIVKSSKDFDLEVMENVKVARATLPTEYDDEGEVKKYTEAELKKMKSADVPGGYTAAPEDLRVGQTVKLFLSPPKKQDSKKSDNGDADKSDEAKSKLTPGSTDVARPQVRMVLIQEESTTPEPKDTPKKKKKKDG
jgi:hypothetical protein